MSVAKSSPLPAACPRCRATQIEVRSTSLVVGVWTVFACATCLCAWRSTEPEENTNPDKYSAAFRLKPEQLADLAVIPAIPALRAPSSK